ncbi:MAG: hypothetical protein ABR985_00570 [Methanotrichaceae archaeon]
MRRRSSSSGKFMNGAGTAWHQPCWRPSVSRVPDKIQRDWEDNSDDEEEW